MSDEHAELDRIHGPEVARLVAVGDWAALCRYWFIHQYPPALDEAIGVAERLGGIRGTELGRFLGAWQDNPFDLDREPPGIDPADNTDAENATLNVLLHFPYVALCETAKKLPVVEQDQALRVGIESARYVIRLARWVEDMPLVAFFLGFLGTGLLTGSDPEGAVRTFREAEAIYRELAERLPGVFRPDLGFTLNHLGKAFNALGDSEREAVAFREAEVIYRELAEWRPETFRSELAGTLNNLGNALSRFGDTEGGEGAFREAEAIYRELAERRPDVFRPVLAMTLTNLGNTLHDLGDPAGAVRVYREAEGIHRELTEQWPEAFRLDLASTLNNLGYALNDLGDPEEAVRVCREAEDISREQAKWRPEAVCPELAGTLNNLGNALRGLGDPEGGGAFQEAEAIYRELAERRPDAFRPVLAMTLSNLGNARSGLGDPEGAVRAYGESEVILRELAERQPEAFRPHLASTLTNLGTALHDLGDPAGAVRVYREAEVIRRELAELRPDAFRSELANTLNNLGNALHTLGDWEGGAGAIREAEVIYRNLAERRPNAFCPRLAATLNNLGNALSALGDPVGAVVAHREAVSLFNEAAGQVPTAFLDLRVRSATNLGKLLLTTNIKFDWPDHVAAREALRTAHQLIERLRGQFKDRKQRRRVLQESMESYRLLVEVCVDIGRINGDPTAWPEAAEVAEASRSRALMELLAEQELTPANTPVELVDKFRTLRKEFRDATMRLEMEIEQKVQNAESHHSRVNDARQSRDGRSGVRSPQLLDRYYQTPKPDRREFLTAEVGRLSAEHTCLLKRVREHDPVFDPDEPVSPVSFPERQALLPVDRRTAVVHYTLTENRGVALVITRAGVEAVELPGLNAHRGTQLGNEWYAAYREAIASPRKMEAWAAELPLRLEPMSHAAVWPVLGQLQGFERVILVPAGAMHLFPLHASVLPDGSYFADQFEVGYTPSLSVLARCRGRTRPTPIQLLSAVNPTADLHFAEPEADSIRRHFSTVGEKRREDVTR